MAEKEGSAVGILSFILGAIFGAGLALLVTPKTGGEMREKVKEAADKLKDVALEKAKELLEEAKEEMKKEQEEAAEKEEEAEG